MGFLNFLCALQGFFRDFIFVYSFFFTLAMCVDFHSQMERMNHAEFGESGIEGDRNRATQKYYRIKMDVWTMIMWNEST